MSTPLQFRPRLAIVVQRYGEEVSGGAELHARWLAERLTAFAEVHVLTTCALEYQTWADYYPAGENTLKNVTIHRHPVDQPRHWKQAQKFTKKLILNDHSLFDELAWMQAQGPISTPLLKAIEQGYEQFDAYIFFTYLYATTFFGLPLVSDKAILVPTAHDDPFLRFPLFRPIFHLPRAIVYNTYTEQRLVNEVMRNYAVEQIVAGIGINVPERVSAEHFRQKHNIDGDFILYVGRIDHSKSVPQLLDYFSRFHSESSIPIQLILAGKSTIDIPDHPAIRHIGFISEQDKFNGLHAATLLAIPSHYESLSMIALEAWLTQTPTLVNGACQVLKDQTRLSNGGLYYESYAEFHSTLMTLLTQPTTCEKLGENGRVFVESTYKWDKILKKYYFLLEQICYSNQ